MRAPTRFGSSTTYRMAFRTSWSFHNHRVLLMPPPPFAIWSVAELHGFPTVLVQPVWRLRHLLTLRRDVIPVREARLRAMQVPAIAREESGHAAIAASIRARRNAAIAACPVFITIGGPQDDGHSLAVAAQAAAGAPAQCTGTTPVRKVSRDAGRRMSVLRQNSVFVL
jgi:hypothetical protein